MGVIETVDIIRDLVANMPIYLNIKAVTDNTDGTYLIETCNTSYLQKGFKLELDGQEYKIESVTVNESAILKGDLLPTKGKKVLPPLHFKHGSILQANSELTQVTDVFEKTPMVYLKRTFTENWGDDEDAVERTANINLFFLTQADFEAWMTEDHDHHAIRPMRNVLYSFVDYLKNRSDVGVIKGYTTVDRIKFGMVVDLGVKTQYWNDKLSGVELQINLPISKGFKCKC